MRDSCLQTPASVGLVKQRTFHFAGLELESGQSLGPVVIAYETYGQLNERGDNAILVCHALTGDAHVAGWNESGDLKPGWWDPLIGPGKVFDTRTYYVICTNVLGGCQGSTGPASINPVTGRPYRMLFPTVTILDMVRAQNRLLITLGVRQLHAVVGGSMGGMQAYAWAVHYPKMVARLIVLGAPGRSTAQGIAFNKVCRQAIRNDPDWQGGDYYPGPGPVAGLALARMIGMITFQSDASMSRKFGRRLSDRNEGPWWETESQFEVESYLDHQGEALVRRFDANSLLYLSKAMDLFDLGRGFASYEAALSRISARTLVIGIDSDILYPPWQQQEVCNILQRQSKDVQYWELESPYGHDAFLIEYDKLRPILGAILR